MSNRMCGRIDSFMFDHISLEIFDSLVQRDEEPGVVHGVWRSIASFSSPTILLGCQVRQVQLCVRKAVLWHLAWRWWHEPNGDPNCN